MEVFIRNIPRQMTDKSLHDEFKPILSKLSNGPFSCQALGKSAILTFLHKQDGEKFLKHHGQIDNGSGRRVNASSTTVQLFIYSQPIYCTQSKKDPDKSTLRYLEREEKQDLSQERTTDREADEPCRDFTSSSISCGVWAYEGEELVFAPQFTLSSEGRVRFDVKTLTIIVGGLSMECEYQSIVNIAAGGISEPSMTIALDNPPRFAKETLSAQLARVLGISGNKKDLSRVRSAGLDKDHEPISNLCLVYRISIKSSSSFHDQVRDLQKLPHMPHIIWHRSRVRDNMNNLKTEMEMLVNLLGRMCEEVPFCIMFQMQKLAQNSYLLPSRVTALLPDILSMYHRSGTDITIATIRKLLNSLPYAGPQTEAAEFHYSTLVGLLVQYEDQINSGETSTDLTCVSNANIAGNATNVFRAKITPTGISLLGPERETNNRVLRKYSSHSEYFLRVQFCDEDGDVLRYHPMISNDKVYHEIFKSIFSKGIKIAGRKYSFLGFSHSSLRARSCWFMAPFIYNGLLHNNQFVIHKLGDFSHIQSPAKCAARIGQAFSDTPTTVSLGSAVVKVIPDVERNGRIFSDGVGTISEGVLEKIWAALPNRGMKPTSFQIRHSGAKGMVSLDIRLKEDVICLRESMIKFPGSDATDIELCGSAYKPLQLYLNKQVIKILEDLGVEDKFFVELQAKAVHRLRQVTTGATNAANFLKDHSHSVGETFYLSLLIKKLSKLGLHFREDPFLRNLVEMAVFIELRNLKHRARIPVEHGVTLYGIMDETGILDEGQIFCRLEYEPGKPSVLVTKDVIITRCPALHPGDCQVVEAVDVPVDSPLRELSNCVIFSQKGQRDLPSKLSGGDLDGDLYNIIWDNRARLKIIYPPADYPRPEPIDIGRPVTTDDMTNFFIEFMATDQLGLIATRHLILADFHEEGTFHEHCLTLAEMHSTAVDYSKTGVAVDLAELPKNISARPDFMAPGPNITIGKSDRISLEESQDIGHFQRYRYYESNKILGTLYRAIDEQKLFSEIQAHDSMGNNDSVMRGLWEFIDDRSKSVVYNDLLDKARDARELFEDTVLNYMYSYSQHPLRPLTESEIFVGNILGKTGSPSKQQRELSTTMKDEFEKDLIWFVNSVLKGNKALEMCLAMFKVSFEDPKHRKNGEVLRSFKYVAAGMCCKEIIKVSNDMFNCAPL